MSDARHFLLTRGERMRALASSCLGDMFDAAGLRSRRVTITAGLEATSHSNSLHLQISNLEARSHSGELRIAAAAEDAGALKEEIKDFKRKISEASRTTYAAPVGAHDDLVLSVAITLWMATQRPVNLIEPLPLGSKSGVPDMNGPF